MICDTILGNLKTIHSHKSVMYVSIDWFERDKKVLRKILASGEEIGIRPPRPLNEGDILFEDETRIIAVQFTECDLIRTEVAGMEEMGRLCFELGNRHLSLSIDANCVRCPYDAPTLEYLVKLGFHSIKVHEKFQDYIECRGHSHVHSHSHEHHHA